MKKKNDTLIWPLIIYSLSLGEMHFPCFLFDRVDWSVFVWKVSNFTYLVYYVLLLHWPHLHTFKKRKNCDSCKEFCLMSSVIQIPYWREVTQPILPPPSKFYSSCKNLFNWKFVIILLLCLACSVYQFSIFTFTAYVSSLLSEQTFFFWLLPYNVILITLIDWTVKLKRSSWVFGNQEGKWWIKKKKKKKKSSCTLFAVAH